MNAAPFKLSDAEVQQIIERLGRRLKRIRVTKRYEAKARSVGRRAAKAGNECEAVNIVATGLLDIIAPKIVEPMVQEIARVIAKKAVASEGFVAGGPVLLSNLCHFAGFGRISSQT